jgi:hypothetical protein
LIVSELLRWDRTGEQTKRRRGPDLVGCKNGRARPGAVKARGRRAGPLVEALEKGRLLTSSESRTTIHVTSNGPPVVSTSTLSLIRRSGTFSPEGRGRTVSPPSVVDQLGASGKPRKV